MAEKIKSFGADLNQDSPTFGTFGVYTYDDVTGTVLKIAVSSLVGGNIVSGSLKKGATIRTAPDANGNEVINVSQAGFTVDLNGGGPGNFTGGLANS